MTVTTALPTAEALARKFSALLLEDLGAEVLAECVYLNKTPEYAGCCATHNCCDTNMVMLAAVEEFGLTEDDVFENDCDNAVQRLWNEAWDVARAAGFYL